MIISVHMPKTAGTSFGATLTAHYGSALLLDTNGDLGCDIADCTLSSEYERYKVIVNASLQIAEMDFPGVECIHGHLHAHKYLLLAYKRELKFVTWLRNPVDRLLSQYNFWKRNCENPMGLLHVKFIQENWSLEQFCFEPAVKNMYGDLLWGFPLEYFDFIGITEFYNDDLEYFARHYLNSQASAQMLNAGDNNGRAYQIDSQLRKEIEAFHDRDMYLYQRALEMRQKRLGA
jgi:hypothetical protein